MRAAVLREIDAPLTIETVQIDDPGPGEVLIATAAAGVCHSDYHFMNGHYSCELPVVPGHESAGVIEAVGPDVDYVKPGDQVITCMSVACGDCRFCAADRPVLCADPRADRAVGASPRLSDSGRSIGQLYNLASYAEKMLVSERAVVKIRDDMPLDRAALIGCAVMTGFGAAVNTAQVAPGSSVAVIGCGGVGLSAILGAVAAEAETIIAIDIHDDKLATAKHFGATHIVNSVSDDPVDAVRDLSSGGVDFSFEALGRKDTSEQSFAMIANGGCATIIGMVPEGQRLEIDPVELVMEKRLQGSNMGSNRFRIDMPDLVDRYLAGTLPLDDMISKRIRLDDINEGFADMLAGRTARSVIVFGD